MLAFTPKAGSGKPTPPKVIALRDKKGKITSIVNEAQFACYLKELLQPKA